jgi:PAS domain S-box-containing protein
MSPGSAIVLLLLGGALLAGIRHPTCQRGRRLSVAGAAFALLVSASVLVRHVTGIDFGLGFWPFRGGGGAASAEQMPALIAGALVVASLGLLVLLEPSRKRPVADDVAASAAAGVMVVGGLSLLGYFWSGALAAAGGTIPMALPTAAGFVFLGGGLLAGAKRPVLTGRAVASLAVGFAAGLAASVALFALVSGQEDSRIRGEFDRKADVIAVAFRRGIKDAVEELDNLRALFLVAGPVERSTFRDIATPILNRHASIRALAWAPWVSARGRAAVEAAARREGMSGFQFTERTPAGGLGPAGRRAEYAPVLYVEPLHVRQAALGFDVFSEPIRHTALELARDTDRATATEPIAPVAGTLEDRGMLIFQPVYRTDVPTATVEQKRAALRGFLIETLELERLVRGALPDLDRAGVEFRLVDATRTLDERAIHASPRVQEAVTSPLRSVIWVTVLNRQWRLDLYAAPWRLAARRGERAWLVLSGGLVVTVLLGAYMLASVRHTVEVERLAEGLRKVSRAVEQSPVSVVITDPLGAIEYVNPKFTQVTGYTFEEVRGQNPRILKSGEMPPDGYRDLWSTIAAGGEWRGEFQNKKKTGEIFWEAASISPVRAPDGRVTHYVAVKEDITEWKRMQTVAAIRTHQLETIRAVTAEVTRELDLRRLLRLITERATELTGASSGGIHLWDEPGGVLIPTVFHGAEATRPRFPRRLGEGLMGAVARKRRGALVNDYRTSPHAHPRTLETTEISAVLAEPLLYRDRLLGVITVQHHRGERTFGPSDQEILRLFAAQAAIAIENARLYEQARDHAAMLERQVRERTRDLDAALRVAETASRAKSEFLSNMSHELRTPLNGILGFSEILLHRAHTLSREKHERFVGNIHASGRRLLELVSQVLDFATTEAGDLSLDRRPLAPGAVLEAVVADVRPLAERKGVVLRTAMAADLPLVNADPARLRQIGFNLLTNAVKFTPPGGTVTIGARVAGCAQDGDAAGAAALESTRPPAETTAGMPDGWLEVWVADTGIGIRAEDVARLFQEFSVLESAYTKRHAGSGIGLALTKRLVELHGGRIWVESGGEGRGSTFRVAFPTEPLAESACPPNPAAANDPRQGTDVMDRTEERCDRAWLDRSGSTESV